MTYISDQYPKIILHKPYVKPVLELNLEDFNVHQGLLNQIIQENSSINEELTAEKVEEIVMDLYKSTGILMIDRNDEKVSATKKKEKKEGV